MAYGQGLKENQLGAAIIGSAITATLYVSPNGDDSNGSTWSRAYTTIQGALDIASTDANNCTLILVAPHATYYDIDTTGDPTWAGNYEIRGSHRNWVKVSNDHGTATSIMKFTGKVSISDLTFDCGSGTLNGVIITGSGTKGSRLRRTYFECEHVTGAQTALEISGGTEYIRLSDVMFHGVVANTTGLLLDDVKLSDYIEIQFHDCLKGLQFTNADTDENRFRSLIFHDCTIALDIDAGNEQIFSDVEFFNNTTNVDDEVADHLWNNISGEFEITIEPEDLSGVTLDSGPATWGNDTEIRAAVTSTKPFKVVAYQVQPSHEENMLLRLSADSGSTYFVKSIFATKKNKAGGYGAGSDFIFNAGTRISGSLWTAADDRDVDIWLEIQEI